MLHTLPAEILLDIFEYALVPVPAHYAGYYQEPPQSTTTTTTTTAALSTPSLLTLARRNGLGMAHVCSKLYYTLSPPLWARVRCSAVDGNNKYHDQEGAHASVLHHVTHLEVDGFHDTDHNTNGGQPNTLAYLRPALLPHLKTITVDAEDRLLANSAAAVQAWLAQFPAARVHMVNVSVFDLQFFTDGSLLNRVETVVFTMPKGFSEFASIVQSAISRMTSLKALRYKSLAHDLEAHCFVNIPDLSAITTVQHLPLLQELDLSDLTDPVETTWKYGQDWFPRGLTMLKCDWNLMQTILATNSPDLFYNVRDLTITMTRKMQPRVPDISPFINVEKLTLIRGPSPWPQDDVLDLFGYLLKKNTKLVSLTLNGISSKEIAALAPMLTNLHDITVQQLPEDSYGLGLFPNRRREIAPAPVNHILSAAGAGPHLKLLDIHVTQRAHGISYPLLESLILDSVDPLAIQLTHIIIRYEQKELYERKHPNPLDKIFSGFSSNKFSLQSFCSPLRSPQSLYKEANCASFSERRDLFGPTRLYWDPIVVDVGKLRDLLLTPPRGSRIAKQPLTGAIFSRPPAVHL